MENYGDIERRLTSAEKRIENLETQDHVKSLEQAVISTKLDNISQSLVEMKDNLKILMEQPAKRWDNIVTTAFSTIVSIIVSAVITGSVAFAVLKPH